MSEVREVMSRFEFPERLGRFAQRFGTFEEVWEECERADWMLWLMDTLRRGSRRGLRLFICACARQWWLFISDVRSQRAIECAEKYARGEVSIEAVEFVREGALKAALEAAQSSKPIMSRAARLAVLALEENILEAAREASELATAAGHAINETQSEDKELALLSQQADLLRSLMPNPFSCNPATSST